MIFTEIEDGVYADEAGRLRHDLIYRVPNPPPPPPAPMPGLGEILSKEEEEEVRELEKLRRQYRRKLRQEEIERLKRLLKEDPYHEVIWR